MVNIEDEINKGRHKRAERRLSRVNAARKILSEENLSPERRAYFVGIVKENLDIKEYGNI